MKCIENFRPIIYPGELSFHLHTIGISIDIWSCLGQSIKNVVKANTSAASNWIIVWPKVNDIYRK